MPKQPALTLTYDQVAEILSMSIGAIKMIIQRGTLTGGGGYIYLDSVWYAYLSAKGKLDAYKAWQVAQGEVAVAVRLETAAQVAAYELGDALDEGYARYFNYFTQRVPEAAKVATAKAMAQSAAVLMLWQKFDEVSINAQVQYGVHLKIRDLYKAMYDLHQSGKFRLTGLTGKEYGSFEKYYTAAASWLSNHTRKAKAKGDVAAVLVHGQKGNSNAGKYTRDEYALINGLLLRCYISGLNWSDAQTARWLGDYLDMYGYDIEKPGYGWVKSVWKPKNIPIINLYRYDRGHQNRQAMESSLLMAPAPAPNVEWQKDSTRLNYAGVVESYFDERTGKTKTRTWFLYRCIVIDCYSKAVLGYSYGVSEDGDLYEAAMEMAIARSGGVLPKHLVCDQFPGHNNASWTARFPKFEKYGVEVHFAKELGMNQLVERTQKTIQDVAMQNSVVYTGQGVRSREAHAQRTDKQRKHAHQILAKGGYGLDDIAEEDAYWLETYNTMPLSKYSTKHPKCELSPLAIYEKGEQVVEKAKEQAIPDLFWQSRTETMRHRSIQVKHNGELTAYYLPDWETVKLMNRDLRVCVNAEMKDYIYVFDAETDEYLIKLEAHTPEYKFSEAGKAMLGAHKERRTSIENGMKAELASGLADAPQLNESDFVGGRITGKAAMQEAEATAEIVKSEKLKVKSEPLGKKAKAAKAESSVVMEKEDYYDKIARLKREAGMVS